MAHGQKIHCAPNLKFVSTTHNAGNRLWSVAADRSVRDAGTIQDRFDGLAEVSTAAGAGRQRLDDAFRWGDNFTFAFAGTRYWKLDGGHLVSGYPQKIRDGFPGLPDQLDASFVWGERIIFVSGMFRK